MSGNRAKRRRRNAVPIEAVWLCVLRHVFTHHRLEIGYCRDPRGALQLYIREGRDPARVIEVKPGALAEQARKRIQHACERGFVPMTGDPPPALALAG